MTATFTVQELADRVAGRVEGDPRRRLAGVASVDAAGPEELTFLAGRRQLRRLAGRSPGAVLAPEDLPFEPGDACVIRVENPELAFCRLVPLFVRVAEPAPGIHPDAVVSPEARLGADVRIGPGAVVGDGARIGRNTWIEAHAVVGEGVRIEEDCRLGPGCTIAGRSVLGRRVHVQAGARVGCDGFGYVRTDEGPRKFPQVGRCRLGDDVEIGANSTIDRGSLGDTVVGAGTKIDNLVHIGHNCRLGEGCLIAGQVGIAGSTVLGAGVRVAGQVGIAGHLEIGAGASIGAKSGVMSDIPAGETWSGYPARPHRTWLRATAGFFRLPELARRVERLERDGSAPSAGRKEGNGE
ncbi:MAG: UDP-3-O-(3-hydroxymyristoyl)glucosamine N-acyltransferase [Gemmatimonadota bacterium]|nr:UDP-3-O-(3-hydroxymyristoyl)glucosamine N-acyltransferase [Gemmatimonadota bacterium]